MPCSDKRRRAALARRAGAIAKTAVSVAPSASGITMSETHEKTPSIIVPMNHDVMPSPHIAASAAPATVAVSRAR